MEPKEKIIKIQPTYDKAGNARFDLQSYPKGCGIIQQCVLYPERVIPIIFIPGVMGSNLKSTGKDSKEIWNLNSKIGIARAWLGVKADVRKEKLDPLKTAVDDSGSVDEKEELFLLKTRQQRGWGSVACTSYAPFLGWLQDELNDFSAHSKRAELLARLQVMDAGAISLQQEEIDLTRRYLYPVFAVGYNWLQSNADSAKDLEKKIDTEIIKFYQSKGLKCEKVILITHSMGGLVARHYTENLGNAGKVLGVVHGVMPALGAAAVYRRMKAGTEYSTWSLVSRLSSKVLGGDAQAMTAVLAQSPGPMQLLPGREYGAGWLKIVDGKDVHSYPGEDPYGEIYLQRDKWWGLCEQQFINPGKKPAGKVYDREWSRYTTIMKNYVQPFIEELAGQYHAKTYAFYSAAPSYAAYGDVVWQSETPVREQRKSQGRSRRPAEGRALDKTEDMTVRSVATPLDGNGQGQEIRQTWQLLPPDEAGDGTVPVRSGKVAARHLQARYPVAVEHEPAYQDEQARQFTLRALVKIIQDVKQTTLAYP